MIALNITDFHHLLLNSLFNRFILLYMRYNSIDKKFFLANRKRLSKKLKPGSIALLFANYQMPRNGDQYHSYRQNSDFFYLTGIEQEKSILLLTPDAATNELKEVLFILRSNKLLEIWEGHKHTIEEASEISGISYIKLIDDFEDVLHSLTGDAKHIYLNVPEPPKFNPEIASRDADYANKLKEKYPLHSFERMAPIMQELRLTKSETEIGLIKEAINITDHAFRNVLSGVKPGMKEYEIEAIIGYEFIRHGAAGHAYAPIVASGKNACVLHYTENDNQINKEDLILMDFGAEYANYAADLSRTIPADGKFSKRQRGLYDANLRVFKYARSLMVPGATINSFHKKVCEMWQEEHIKLGLYTKDQTKKPKKENELWFEYYMHGTSHFMGLDVHDPGSKEIVFKPGMILTCEPGIYIAKEGIGIRIENDILITKEGNIDLMQNIPIDPEEIESLMATP